MRDGSKASRTLGRDEIGRLTLLMEELLEYGKPLGGDLFLVSTEEMVARSVRACLPAAEVAKVTLQSHLETSLPKIKIDRRRLSKVFVNLIENAIQHSPPGATVTIEAQRFVDGKDEWVQCAVKDAGGVICQPGDAAQLAGQIVELSCDPIRRKEMGEQARQYAMTHLQKSTILKKFESSLCAPSKALHAVPSSRSIW